MPKEIKFVADNNGELKSIIWISLQDEGSISIGMSDRSFLIPGFTSQLEFEGNIHKNHVNLKDKYTEDVITNPHFTFHPPMYVHLRANKKEELFAGLLGVDFIVEEEGRMPWIRFVSNPINQLKKFTQPRGGKDSEIVRYQIQTSEISLGIGIDFINTYEEQQLNKSGNYIVHWHGRILHVFAKNLDAQKSTVQWFHKS